MKPKRNYCFNLSWLQTESTRETRGTGRRREGRREGGREGGREKENKNLIRAKETTAVSDTASVKENLIKNGVRDERE